MESFVLVCFLVCTTVSGTAGDGDTSGLLFFNLFFLVFGGHGLGVRWLNSIQCAVPGIHDSL